MTSLKFSHNVLCDMHSVDSQQMIIRDSAVTAREPVQTSQIISMKTDAVVPSHLDEFKLAGEAGQHLSKNMVIGCHFGGFVTRLFVKDP